MSVVASLRSRTSADHHRVDAAFSAYRLTNKGSYLRFLLAHARALVTAETYLARAAQIPAWRSRTALLQADLVALGSTMPDPLPLLVPARSESDWGIFYVLEGSRLGGGLLATLVPDRFPTGYLGAVHEPGEWRSAKEAIDAAGATESADWVNHAAIGAVACFDLYWRAAAASPP